MLRCYHILHRFSKKFQRNFLLKLWRSLLLSTLTFVSNFARRISRIFNRPRSLAIHHHSLSLKQIKHALKKLDRSTTEGYSALPVAVLIYCADALAPPLLELYKRCIDNGDIPKPLKLAIVTPHYKVKGLKTYRDSYMPISIISPLSKILERFLVTQINNQFDGNSLLYTIELSFSQCTI